MMKVLPPASPLPELGGDGFSIASWNVLLPNSVDGWWIYKYYRKHVPEEHREWPYRRELMRSIILGAGADIVCVQEAAAESFEDDFKFMADAGYEHVLHTKSRFRTATFWKTSRFVLVSRHDKDRTLVTAFRPVGEGGGGAKWGGELEGYSIEQGARTFWVINCHLTGGPNPDKRLRQVHDALEQVRKEVTKAETALKKQPAKKGAPPTPPTPPCRAVVCGDFNSDGQTGVRELLISGEVPAGYSEGGSVLTSKAKKQTCGAMADALEEAHEGKPPPTFIAPFLDEVLGKEIKGGEIAPSEGLHACLVKAFAMFAGSKGYMDQDDVDAWLVRINRKTGRGSEMRSAAKLMEEHPEKKLEEYAFVEIYAAELREGKFWGVDHDMEQALGLQVERRQGEHRVTFETNFDHCYFTRDTLCVECVRDPLTPEEREKARTEDPLPNSWQPSDHLLQSAAFRFLDPDATAKA